MDNSQVSRMYNDENTPEMDLLAAASIGDLSVVNKILQHGNEVDQRNESGWTAIMYAAHYGHYNVIKMLIDHGGSVNVQEWVQGRSPLMLAASCGHTRCLEVLITLGGADIEMQDFQGRNAAYYAIHSGHGRNKIIAKLLKIQPKPRCVARAKPISKPNNPDIVVTKEEEKPSNGNQNRISSSLSPLSPNFCKSAGFYSPYFGGSNSFSNNTLKATPINQFFTPLTTPTAGMNSSYSSFQQNQPINFTPHISIDMRKRRLAMQNGDNFSDIPFKTARACEMVNAMNTLRNHRDLQHQTKERPLDTESGNSNEGNAKSNYTNDNINSSNLIADPKNSSNQRLTLAPYGVAHSPISNTSSGDLPNDTGISVSVESSSNPASSPSTGGNSSCDDPLTSLVLDRGPHYKSPLPDTLDDLLERIGLSQYSKMFTSQGIDLYCFMTLDEADLDTIGVTLMGHKRKIYLAQLRFRESVEITSSQERFLADWLLSERESLKKENHELRKKLRTLESVTN